MPTPFDTLDLKQAQALVGKRALTARYGCRCLSCGRHESAAPLTADHVVPISRGGSNTIGNIQPLCKPCNSRKGTATTDVRPLWEGE